MPQHTMKKNCENVYAIWRIFFLKNCNEGLFFTYTKVKFKIQTHSGKEENMDVYITGALNINQEKTENMANDEFLEVIYRQYYKNVYNYISFRINNHFDSEELTSSVFEKAMRKSHTYNPDLAPAEAWLVGIAKNVVTDYLRSKKRKFFIPLDDIVSLVSSDRQPEEVILINDENKELMQAMAKLRDNERQILSMKFATDLKNHEIAKIVGITESNVGVIIHRAIKK